MANNSAEFDLNISTWKYFLKKLKDKTEDLPNNKELGGIISSNVFKDVIDHFETEEGSVGNWAAWSDAYQNHMEKIGRSGNKILQFSGKLRQNFTPKKYRSVPGGILFYNNAKTKSGFPYAWAHNEGEGDLPTRDFMWLSEIAMRDVASQVSLWLAGK